MTVKYLGEQIATIEEEIRAMEAKLFEDGAATTWDMAIRTKDAAFTEAMADVRRLEGELGEAWCKVAHAEIKQKETRGIVYDMAAKRAQIERYTIKLEERAAKRARVEKE